MSIMLTNFNKLGGVIELDLSDIDWKGDPTVHVYLADGARNFELTENKVTDARKIGFKISPEPYSVTVVQLKQ